MMAPWDEYAQAAKALFADDPDVTVDDAVEVDGGDYRVVVRVHGDDKAESISELMPTELTYGNVTLYVEVVPDNERELSTADHLRRAFAGNPALVDVMEVPVVPGGPALTYALFAPEVAQVECDNAGSPYGLLTTTYEAIAKDVLAVDGVLLTSDIADD